MGTVCVCVCLCICACMCVRVCAHAGTDSHIPGAAPAGHLLCKYQAPMRLGSECRQEVQCLVTDIAQPCTCDPHWQGSPGALGLGGGGVGAEEAEVETAAS